MESLTKYEILLVEDNASETELILRILKKNKVSNGIKAFKDGISALEYIYARFDEEKSPDSLPQIVFLDLNMPGIDGLDVLRKIKSDNRIKHIPVVILTSSDDEALIMECYRSGANSYIIKPVVYNLFVEYINKIILYWISVIKSPK